MFIEVTAADDSRLDDYRNIPDPELIARRGIFVAEGHLIVRRLLTESRFVARSVMVTEAARASLMPLLSARPELPVYVVPQPVVNVITGFNIHRGCLAIGERPPVEPWEDVARNATVLLVLERVANADNVGGVFRNAAAFDASAVLLDAASTDPLYRKAIRTSMGAALVVPFARAEPWPQMLTRLRDLGFVAIAMTPSATASALQHCADAVRGQRVAFVLGHEGEGLSAAALERCDSQARIPMAPGIDSLNVATASAIALYELRRGDAGRLRPAPTH